MFEPGGSGHRFVAHDSHIIAPSTRETCPVESEMNLHHGQRVFLTGVSVRNVISLAAILCAVLMLEICPSANRLEGVG